MLREGEPTKHVKELQNHNPTHFDYILSTTYRKGVWSCRCRTYIF